MIKRTAGLITVLCLFLTGNAFGSADGWASQNGGTTGGQGGPTVTVTNEADLLLYAQSTTPGPYIVQVSGTITLSGGVVEISAKKTLRGVGVNPTLIGNIDFKNRDGNIIVERLNISNPHKGSSYDGMSVTQDICNVVVTQCSFYDCGDGCLDISNRSNYITVSWCKFYYTPSAPDPGHTFSSLVGSSDDATSDRDKLKVTYHHNWWTTGCKERMPRVRFGQVHVYNNYYSDLVAGGYCIGVGVEAHLRVENNYFNAVPDPWKDYYTDTGGAVGEIGWNTGNIYYNCTEPTWAVNNYATIFTPPYAYTPDAAADIPAIVQWGAGADGKDGMPPHWYFSYYGDFDRSGLVDMTDLVTFAGYWLDTETIADADYDASGRVDNVEFSLFSSNWYKVASDVTAPAAPANVSVLAGDGLVSLDWNDNSEPDIDGYNIYRSTTSQTNYVKLNPVLLADSNYIDGTVTNNTVYFYVVKAVDTSFNESVSSSEVSVVPIDANTIIIQENATGFCGLDGIVDVSGKHAGYTGVGYLDTTNATGSGANYRIHAETDGAYTLVWRYANGSTDRPARLLVNSVERVASTSFAATGAWTNWSTVTMTATLIAGDNTIRLEAMTAGGLANIDFLRTSGLGIAAAGCQ